MRDTMLPPGTTDADIDEAMSDPHREEAEAAFMRGDLVAEAFDELAKHTDRIMNDLDREMWVLVELRDMGCEGLLKEVVETVTEAEAKRRREGGA